MLSTKVIKNPIVGPRLPFLNDEASAQCLLDTKNTTRRQFTTHISPRPTTPFTAAGIRGSRTGQKLQRNVIFTGLGVTDEQPQRKRDGLKGSLSLRNFNWHNVSSREPLEPLKALYSYSRNLLHNALSAEKEAEREEDSSDTGQREKLTTYRRLQQEARKWDRKMRNKQSATRLEQITEKTTKKEQVKDLGLYIPKYGKPETPVVHNIRQIKLAGKRQNRVQTPKGQPTPARNILHKLGAATTPRKEMKSYIEAKTPGAAKELNNDLKESALSKYMRKGKPDEEVDAEEVTAQEKVSIRPSISFSSPPKSFMKKPNSGLYTASSDFLKVSPPNETQVNYTSSQMKTEKNKSSKQETKKTAKAADKEASTENPETPVTPFEPILSASTVRAISMNSAKKEKMRLRQDSPLRGFQLFKDTSLEWWNKLAIYKRQSSNSTLCQFAPP